MINQCNQCGSDEVVMIMDNPREFLCKDCGNSWKKTPYQVIVDDFGDVQEFVNAVMEQKDGLDIQAYFPRRNFRDY